VTVALLLDPDQPADAALLAGVVPKVGLVEWICWHELPQRKTADDRPKPVRGVVTIVWENSLEMFERAGKVDTAADSGGGGGGGRWQVAHSWRFRDGRRIAAGSPRFAMFEAAVLASQVPQPPGRMLFEVPVALDIDEHKYKAVIGAGGVNFRQVRDGSMVDPATGRHRLVLAVPSFDPAGGVRGPITLRYAADPKSAAEKNVFLSDVEKALDALGALVGRQVNFRATVPAFGGKSKGRGTGRGKGRGKGKGKGKGKGRGQGKGTGGRFC
jgi:hypothetical protein